MIQGDAESWNVRDVHMADTLDRLIAFHRTKVDTPKAIVWAHNTHIGDARATDMAGEGMINLGQLARERHEVLGVVLVGFSAHHGAVIAARAWGEAMERMTVPDAMPGSWDDLLLERDSTARLLITERIADRPGFQTARGHRAIGVVYRPRFERLGNYVPTILPERYDAVLSFRKTLPLNPLHIGRVEEAEIPETFPSGV
jgi:erythromycin esterase-like protein